mgnify:CR=1 FL=1|tara:strand:+ start:1435 stop:2052 length:618 start_codon:yes stop_codon:yes gene_type:complete
MSTIKTTNITHASNSGTNNLILDDTGKVSIAEKKLYCPGTIIQVKTSQDTAASTVSLGGAYNWTNLSSFNVQITPTAASSKILVSAFFGGEADWEDHGIFYKLVRDVASVGATDIAIGDAASNRLRATGVMQPGYHGNDNDSTTAHSTIPNYLDSPSTTNQITYAIYMCADAASKTWYKNGTVSSVDNAAYERLSSWLTVMEVAG